MPQDVVQILGFGIIGLGFLLAFFAYMLLRGPVRRERPIYVYMCFCLVLVAIGAYVQIRTSDAMRDLVDLRKQLNTVRGDLSIATNNLNASLSVCEAHRTALNASENKAKAAETKLEQSVQAMREFVSAAPDIVNKLNQVGGFLTSSACPGGSNGRPIHGGAETAVLTTDAVSRLSAAQGAMTRVLSLP